MKYRIKEAFRLAYGLNDDKFSWRLDIRNYAYEMFKKGYKAGQADLKAENVRLKGIFEVLAGMSTVVESHNEEDLRQMLKDINHTALKEIKE